MHSKVSVVDLLRATILDRELTIRLAVNVDGRLRYFHMILLFPVPVYQIGVARIDGRYYAFDLFCNTGHLYLEYRR